MDEYLNQTCDILIAANEEVLLSGTLTYVSLYAQISWLLGYLDGRVELGTRTISSGQQQHRKGCIFQGNFIFFVCCRIKHLSLRAVPSNHSLALRNGK